MKSSRPATLVFAMALAWILPLTLLAWWRDVRAVIGAFDTGLYLQLLHNLLAHGDLACSVVGEGNFLAHHFQPAVLLFAPLVAMAERPFILMLGSTLAVLLSLFLLGRTAAHLPEAARPLGYATAAGLIMQPSIASRLWFSFSPDVLALPAFVWMALALQGPRRASPWLLLVSVLWVGACKESFWLTSGAVAALFFIGRRQWFAAILAGSACLAVFSYLFAYWMPAHSHLPSYYGLSYYLEPLDSQSLRATSAALLANMFSTRSLMCLATLLACTAALPFLSFSLNLAAAVPGLLLILLSRSGIVHHPANHYLLPVLPFLAGAALAQAERLKSWAASSPRLIGWWCVALILIPAAATLLLPAGVIDSVVLLTQHPETAYTRTDAASLKHTFADLLASDLPLIVDGSLQPLFADHRDTSVLLHFTGNPKAETAADSGHPALLITTTDLRQVEDCEKVQLGDGFTMQADYAAFRRLCDRVHTDAKLLSSYPGSGLTAYLLPQKTNQ